MAFTRPLLKLASLALILGVPAVWIFRLASAHAQCCNTSPVLAICQPRAVHRCEDYNNKKTDCLDEKTVTAKFVRGFFACCGTPTSKTNCVPAVDKDGVPVLTLCYTLYFCEYDDTFKTCTRDDSTAEDFHHPILSSVPCPP